MVFPCALAFIGVEKIKKTGLTKKITLVEMRQDDFITCLILGLYVYRALNDIVQAV